MKIYKNFLIGMASLFGLLLTSNTFAADANTQVVIPDHSIITGIQATAQVTLSGSDIQNSIANNTPLETTVIANACMFTTHPTGDYDLTITATTNYISGTNFALYNATLGKVIATLYVSSSDDPTNVGLQPGIAKPLKDHSDDNASGTSCTNQVEFRLSIAVADLRVAQAGTYDFGFSASTTPYSGV